MRSLPRLAAISAVALALSACGGDDDGPADRGPACYGDASVSGTATTFGPRLETSFCYGEPAAMPDEAGVGQASVRPDDFAGAAACGACLELEGTAGTRIVRVVESCVGCAEQDTFDLDAETFGVVTGEVDGRHPITATPVPCPVTGPLRYAVGAGTNPWFVQLWVLDHRHPIEEVELRHGAGWLSTTHTDYHAFQWTSGGTDQVERPYTVRVTDVFGHIVEDEVDAAPGSAASGSAQLPACD